MGGFIDYLAALDYPRLSDFGLPDTAWMAAIVFFVGSVAIMIGWKVLRALYGFLYGSWVRSLGMAAAGVGTAYWSFGAQSRWGFVVTLLLLIPLAAKSVVEQKQAEAAAK